MILSWLRDHCSPCGRRGLRSHRSSGRASHCGASPGRKSRRTPPIQRSARPNSCCASPPESPSSSSHEPIRPDRPRADEGLVDVVLLARSGPGPVEGFSARQLNSSARQSAAIAGERSDRARTSPLRLVSCVRVVSRPSGNRCARAAFRAWNGFDRDPEGSGVAADLVQRDEPVQR